ncbi:MAG TPA: HDOD domain-containing protein [Deltaproteobacteria bacterium]|nr:HDOD domain-containing protein [Deltaproteobacteria bacterium]
MVTIAFFSVVGVLVVVVVLWILVEQARSNNPKPVIRKAPARYVTVGSDDEIQSFMDVYNLDWKPEMALEPDVPDRIREAVEKIEKISPLVTELSSRLNDPDINPKEISRIIVQDQGLTSFILRRVNSPYYGLLQRVDNIFNAIVILGYNEIYRIVMEERTRKIGIRPDKAEWVHANLTSCIASYLSGISRLGISGGTIVTIGMLHDIARTVMNSSCEPPPRAFSTDPRERLRQETEHYGIDHATLGGVLARLWGMPPRLASCIAGHHWPMFWPLRELAKAHGDIVKELSVLAIADVAARNFTQEISGPYIGDDYYRFVNRQPRIDTILVPEITKELKRIRRIMFDETTEEGEPLLGHHED